MSKIQLNVQLHGMLCICFELKRQKNGCNTQTSVQKLRKRIQDIPFIKDRAESFQDYNTFSYEFKKENYNKEPF